MNLLLDTCALLWFASGDERRSSRARRAIESPGHIRFVSVASWWEIAIKLSLGRLSLDDPLDEFMRQRTDEGFRLLTLEPEHLLPLVELPFHHRDPFDRLIVCQAMVENLSICTADENFRRYSIQLLWQ